MSACDASENMLDSCEAWLYPAVLMRPSDPSVVRPLPQAVEYSLQFEPSQEDVCCMKLETE